MKRTILIYGLIAGTILSINMVYMVYQCCTSENFESSEVLGYGVMLVVFSLIFFGIRNYRNKEGNGFITFGKAFKTGALIALIGSSMYVITWIIDYYLFFPDFMEKYAAHVLKETAKAGATATELAEKVKEMEQFSRMYKNPLLVILFTFAEILPMGLVIALISALLLKRKPVAIN